MNILLINWLQGENDPFSLFNQCLSRLFWANGRSTVTVNLDSNFGDNFNRAFTMGVDFALTWQGLGSNIRRNNSSDETIWDDLGLPLICLHGDHPCHMIANHSGLPKFVSHLYGAESFANYANQYINRSTPALTAFCPNIFTGQITPPDKHEGDYFVLPKNYDDTSETLTSWKLNLPEDFYHMLLDITEAIKDEFNDGNTLGHHDIIDHHLTPFYVDVLMDHFKTEDRLLLRHHIHAICDKFYRNYAAERVLLDLADVRVRIFGRGWERFESKRNPNHEYFPFDKVVDGNSQFCSNYGILDIPPSNDSLHDRTLRAVTNRGGFLLASSWDHEKYLGHDFSSLFYSGQSHQLRERVEQVMQDPEKHRRLATEFGQCYEKTYSFTSFLRALENIARTQKNSVH